MDSELDIDEESLISTNSAYVRRLIWQQLNCPPFVVVSPDNNQLEQTSQNVDNKKVAQDVDEVQNKKVENVMSQSVEDRKFEEDGLMVQNMEVDKNISQNVSDEKLTEDGCVANDIKVDNDISPNVGYKKLAKDGHIIQNIKVDVTKYMKYKSQNVGVRKSDERWEHRANLENDADMFTVDEQNEEPIMEVDPVEYENLLECNIDKRRATGSDRVKPVIPPQSADRYIPKRDNEHWQTRFSCINEVYDSTKKKENFEDGNRDSFAYHYLLQNELLGPTADGILKPTAENKKIDFSHTPRNLFHYGERLEYVENTDPFFAYSLSPIGPRSERLLRSPRKAARKISKIPFKVLDAPELLDDFYLNLVDWSSTNLLAVGLASSVYLWSACTSQVTRLCDLIHDDNTVTSVAWNERGNYVAVGTHHGYVQIWDVEAVKLISKLSGHTARVGAIAWNGDTICSGSRDRMIFQRDIRSTPMAPDRRMIGHRQEVCGLKWSPDNQYLASGGNDNRLYVWTTGGSLPIQTYTDHIAAVKAISWSPHQHGLLASGGGTADRCIRFWNTLTGQAMQCIDTGSQVCNLAWSKHSSELVSTHGYSQNQILVWKYPSLQQVAKLTGHSYRVLYLAVSPDGESIVTGAGDETLRFWNIFSKARSQRETHGELNLLAHIR